MLSAEIADEIKNFKVFEIINTIEVAATGLETRTT